VLDFHCAVAIRHQIFFLWRPYLPDPSDDMILDLAVAARCDYIVTYNPTPASAEEAWSTDASRHDPPDDGTARASHPGAWASQRRMEP